MFVLHALNAFVVKDHSEQVANSYLLLYVILLTQAIEYFGVLSSGKNIVRATIDSIFQTIRYAFVAGLLVWAVQHKDPRMYKIVLIFSGLIDAAFEVFFHGSIYRKNVPSYQFFSSKTM